ncbi:hypothetical protein GRAN_4208 [Granulicella sibirica]|uniref:Uncharacterized protein n=1 Tax=Granulicella sibirica TaxID=2479048 RepID=A0A4V1L5A7_9BACT|nr:hypothetical protein GRAN_4208 [Granulicella sibirica]
MRHDPDIPATIQRYSACHSLDLYLLAQASGSKSKVKLPNEAGTSDYQR